MHQKIPRYERPETVDDLADLLLADLTAEHRKILSEMSQAEFERFYRVVAESLLDEFDLWTGNHKLLASCMTESGEADSTEAEPARIVLEKMRDRMAKDADIMIIT